MKSDDFSIPGQKSTVHVCEAISFIPPFASVTVTNASLEMQFDPPFWGNGLSHTLILELLPSPQDAEHALQSFQDPQSPSTNVQRYDPYVDIHI